MNYLLLLKGRKKPTQNNYTLRLNNYREVFIPRKNAVPKRFWRPERDLYVPTEQKLSPSAF